MRAREELRDREIDKQTDRQTDRKTDIQTKKRARESERLIDRDPERQRDILRERHRPKESETERMFTSPRVVQNFLQFYRQKVLGASVPKVMATLRLCEMHDAQVSLLPTCQVCGGTFVSSDSSVKSQEDDLQRPYMSQACDMHSRAYLSSRPSSL